ncbi:MULTISPECIES: 4Fe-4S ferredoxin [unclassified Pseudodesulfovibrio]|uniref:4Fe-4S ferredoxin n=1 Tax=unclassified Pseudodesulfovibrio TaxID=2661612 RepID=UPI000FEBC46B|nr:MULTISPECIES: 4Fe-4S ferredoxin [unclassified Pseudodesulfovibrio]MCJ2163320.1 4Fe-4S ferredoxin [Pseudodesulfovibrio sp. S3-i]RWU06561.1 4Fe-4S ferredoxin [Pseudodesulfovibrio sp. S3]
MRARPYPAWISRLFIFSVAALAFTGFMQMPLAKRYYLTEVPGMAWTGDFYMVHKIHYLLAALLLFVVGLTVVNWLRAWKDTLVLTRLGALRVAVVGGLVISGGLRVYRNLPDVTLDPAVIVTIEWVHLGLVMVLGAVALIALVRKSSAYAVRK